MSFIEHQARFRRLWNEHAAWHLLRADNAPHILAFVSDLFRESSEVSFGQARAALTAELLHSREINTWDTDTPASTYLRQWIQAGWLRELDDQLMKTDACEVALCFCHGLDQRQTHATASHLRIVQDAVRDLAVALSPNPGERIAILEARKQRLEQEIAELQGGVVRELAEPVQRERVREVYQLASVLTADFRRVEDEIRQLDQALRVDMIESGGGRGEVLAGLLENAAGVRGRSRLRGLLRTPDGPEPQQGAARTAQQHPCPARRRVSRSDSTPMTTPACATL